ncbi:MAG: arginine--tRNA ligase [Candidatus Pacebacteria bacterium]|nr:arginine--tRNA ligase [Candidatus Paceibacterota bacterium]
MSIVKEIKQNILDKINEILSDQGEALTYDNLSYPPDNSLGDISLALFDLSKKLKKDPKQIGDSLKNQLVSLEGIKEIKLVGPYLNFFLDEGVFVDKLIAETIKEKDKFGANKELKGKKIMVEFAHPNPFKAFHIGHLRNIILGESLVRLLEFSKAKVIRTNYQGDVGMHIAKCLWAFKEVKVENYPEKNDDKVALLGKCYAKGAEAFESNEQAKIEIKRINEQIYKQKDKEIKEFWELGKKWSLDKFHEIYKRLYTRFDREYMESEVMLECLEYIKRAQDKGILEESEGAIIFPGEKYGLETRVFLNSQGLPTYDGKELGLAYREFIDFGKLDLCIHNVAIEQISFFKVNFKVQELLDPDRFKGKQYHNAYEFVGLKKGKMSSRLGKVVLAEEVLKTVKEKIDGIIRDKPENKLPQAGNYEELLEKLAINCVKYSFLKVSPFKYLAFDIEESVNFNGNSGLYLNYTYARINSILEKAGKIKPIRKSSLYLNSDLEKKILWQLTKFSEVVETARLNYNPSEIVKYLFELSQNFNDYYHQVSILKSEAKQKAARIKMIKSIAQVLQNGSDLLGFYLIKEM